eukprot:NODE_392_length_9456_cov_0.345517.p4 type:complete len:154 gc:universal NODE_392_length_9456_cov_0.345517:46-507(+)
MSSYGIFSTWLDPQVVAVLVKISKSIFGSKLNNFIAYSTCCLMYSYKSILVAVFTFKDFVTPYCEISTQTSTILKSPFGIPFVSLPIKTTILLGISYLPNILLLLLCSSAKMVYPSFFSSIRYSLILDLPTSLTGIQFSLLTLTFLNLLSLRV